MYTQNCEDDGTVVDGLKLSQKVLVRLIKRVISHFPFLSVHKSSNLSFAQCREGNYCICDGPPSYAAVLCR